ncbi:MAG: hypothetical protein HC898_02800 [Phycisphaerales bacterium]|nr:hypothetical protein [Phycisphaerales bacterium]
MPDDTTTPAPEATNPPATTPDTSPAPSPVCPAFPRASWSFKFSVILPTAGSCWFYWCC